MTQKNENAQAGVARAGAGPLDPDFFFALIIIFLSALALRLYRLDARGFWFDELRATFLLRHGFGGVLRVLGTLRDVPPLYYLFHLPFVPRSMPLDPSGIAPEFLFRLPEAVAGALGVAAAAFLARELGASKPGAIFASFLLAVSPLAVYYSQEATPYALVMLASILSHIALMRLVASPSRRAFSCYVAATAVGVHLHYFFAIAVAAQALFIGVEIIARRRGDEGRALAARFARALGLVVVLSLPLLYFFIFARSGGTPLKGVPFDRFYFDRVLAAFSSGWEGTANMPAGWHRARYLFAFLFLSGLVSLARRKRSGAVLAGVGVVFALIAGKVLIAAIGGTFSARYILFAQPLFLIAAAEGVFPSGRVLGRKPGAVSNALVGVLGAAFLVFPLIAYYRTQLIYDGHGTEDWRNVVKVIRAGEGVEQGAVLCFRDYAAIPLIEFGCEGRIIALDDSGKPGAPGGVMKRMQEALQRHYARVGYFSADRPDDGLLEQLGDEPGIPVWLVLFRNEHDAHVTAALRKRLIAVADKRFEVDFGGQIRLVYYRVRGSRLAFSKNARM